ncbi:putative indole-diterpene biosynthesis protein PaxU [Aspergillus brunneoviolaceus CBS 621.78]|uniref:Indole-diterpene biosynthesis protein PaxU n=1 Tax=Aspergillus brunneoviolaceus CBS 621.78 TaxID=1450534 RepID=A0ACD1GNK7_9EURO|nr:putative indole-diterpene biosynthesis protein PaxU [Aspergillus brunneoviolaceus CBS 621.78]RAH50863.1 putative indole-diterpene biosynthesis protein PaxU [Aspergillus brunneoviolaceus CBS 621.78]
MTTTTHTASTPPPNPLKAFTQLSPSVYIHRPANAPHKPEQIIILAFWMNAHPRTLTKYLTTYLDLYPRATILYTLSTSLDFLINFTARTQHARLQPAVTALRAAAAAADADATTSRDDPNPGPGSSHPRVYIHMFSNGGTFAVAHLLEAYRAATGRPLAVEAMLYDSAPGTSTFRGGMRALAVGLPANPVLRLLGMLVLAGIMGWSMLLTAIMPRADGVMVGRRGTVDAGLVVRGGSRTEGAEAAPRRCYLYSEGDRVVDARDVESHAEEVARRGWEVERVKFDGSAHVSHMRTDPERYWGVVKRYFGGI